MGRRPAARPGRAHRRPGHADEELGDVGRGVVDRVVDDLGEAVDALLDLFGQERAEAEDQRPALKQRRRERRRAPRG
jgi:hypothetical protein